MECKIFNKTYTEHTRKNIRFRDYGAPKTLDGSGNVYRDLGYENANVMQLKSILAAKIIKLMDEEGLSVRKAQNQTGINAADFSRIRNADLDRFTIDRLMTIINRLE